MPPSCLNANKSVLCSGSPTSGWDNARLCGPFEMRITVSRVSDF